MDAVDRIKVLEAENEELRRTLDVLTKAIESVNDVATKQVRVIIDASTKISESLREVATKKNACDAAVKRTYLTKCDRSGYDILGFNIKYRAGVTSECITHVNRGDELIMLMLDLTEKQASCLRSMGIELSLDDDVVTCQ